MLRPSLNHGTLRLHNDDNDDDDIHINLAIQKIKGVTLPTLAPGGVIMTQATQDTPTYIKLYV